ncbi:hypothetical protein AXF42_Ash003806 [Apostasia shenzhenica]|uniref:Trichome birefringence-like N-terminal domain-containing protein n=1 Tax=Apostasia shenzhenica TaxID=1088818 RepID=A0A2I0AHX9_9ASPA|nr:hypothetical protein AXF42_Ash003806 [Apostasia shenzhenica]
MDLRKSLFLDHLFAAVSSKRRVLSAFALGLAASVFVISVLASINAPSAPNSSNASFFSCFFSGRGGFPLRGFNDSAFPSDPGLVAFHQGNSNSSSTSSLANKNAVFNHSSSGSGSTNGSSVTKASPGKFSKPCSGLGFDKTQQSNCRNSSSSNHAEMEQPFLDKKSSASPVSAGTLKRPVAGNSTERDGNATLLAENSRKNIGGKSIQNFAASRSNDSSEAVDAGEFFKKRCDVFDGRWVKDSTKPYYPPGSCPYVDIDFDCYKNGRPDDEFLRWRWQPYDCDIPS